LSDWRQVGGFLWVTLVSSTNKTDPHDKSELLLKVALNTITLKILQHPGILEPPTFSSLYEPQKIVLFTQIKINYLASLQILLCN
jgi:hypothetical protein